MEENGNLRQSKVMDRAEEFAVRMVKLWKYISKHYKEHDISRQAKRSGTSIGANIAEGLVAASKRDFLNKVYIAYKECNETKYWLRVLHKSEYLTHEEFSSIYADANELDKMLTAIIKTTKINLARESLDS